MLAHPTQKALIDEDSRTVDTEVVISQEVCNDLPAESISPENGSRFSGLPILDRDRREYSKRSRVERRGGLFTKQKA